MPAHLLRLHRVRALLRIQLRPLSPDPLDKLINHARPGAVFAPEVDAARLDGLLGKHERLVPHVLVDGPLALLAQKPLPQLEPVDLAAGVAGRRRHPHQALGGEEDGPQQDGSVNVKRPRRRLQEQLEGVPVDALERVTVSGVRQFCGAALDDSSLPVH